MNQKATLINCIFFLALLTSFFLIKQFIDKSTRVPKRNSNQTADAYMKDATYLRTTITGQQDISLFAPYVTHFADKDSSEFIHPRLYFVRNNEKWQVTSKKAKGVNGASSLYLFGDVRVKQLPSKQQTGTLFLTQYLAVYPKKNLVTTHYPVTIEQPGLKINAVGLKGDLNTGNIKLLSHAKGHYDPKK